MSKDPRNLTPRGEIDVTPQGPATIDGEAVEHLPTSDKGYRKLGYAILGIALGGFILWSVTASLAIAVVAPGNVSIESFKRTVQHLEGGIVRDILVEDGDQVEAGDTLIVLSDTQSRSQLEIARSQYLINRAMEARLLAEQEGAQTLEIPDDLQNVESPRLQQVIAVQQSLFTARRQSLQSTLESLDEQIVQMQEQIEGLEQRISVNTRRISSLRAEAEDFRSLYREGLGDNQRLRELERLVLQYEGDNAEFRASTAQLRSQISENRMQREIQTQEFQKEVGEQLRQAQSQIAQAEEQIVSFSDQVERTVVTAPVSGTVVGRQIHTIGAVIRPGDTIMDIVPSNDGFVVEARIPVRDIDNIFIGQFAEIRFSAFNQRLTDEIDGEVIYVSADSFEDEATGQRYYRARVRVTENGYEQMNEHMQLLSGMPAEVMLRTGERTFASYIAKPVTDMLARALQED
ncbi:MULTISPECIES: HlyD family type I secretion periplasmic adaptor subunit [unclassified Halomonas]|uniref:HlyD family type I secretion periplasmic adaptor subunit n=1 Tax=unclassified Halomonas TaxID=2609666 RepID=UPI00209CF103|nr:MULTISPECIES: HlyD family type I secretion periplasmic adaptor subunit [unclassified Halomonas]MCP1314113.1 HlyD family type I secretion periplasmic adaptor subunit [Halomonas sp. 707D7]MCP1325136.1 HlyD family type I secretion periplasmic adaptor subunit [Halomonas sp. 707D4]